MRLAVPFIVDGDVKVESVLLDVLLNLGIQRVLGGGGVTHHEGLHLLTEVAHTVGRSDIQVQRLDMVCLDFRIAGDLLLTRSGKESDKENKG